jgi:shikimate kinase
VVAAGGGAFSRDETRALLASGAASVWLRAPLELLAARLPADGRRPLAASRDRMQALLAEREPSYRLADVTVDADQSPCDVAERVIEALGLAAAGSVPSR